MLTRGASRAIFSPSCIVPRLGRLAASSASNRFPSSKLIAQRPPRRQGFHSTPAIRKGIIPDSADPPSPHPQSSNPDGAPARVSEPSPISTQHYHEYADHYLNLVLTEIEDLPEDRQDLEAEHSAGILNISVGGVGTYVLNKQSPNKQIWLSSPVSGPKQYDWVVEGDQMHEKQDTRSVNGQWVCLRDGSNLTDLLNGELALALPKDVYSGIYE
ncbi:hypothetical protein BJX76DRAFT_350744 [Aspergillus varians]